MPPPSDRRPDLADLLSSAAAERARDYWRRLERIEKSGTDAWLRARLKVAESSLATGDVAEAKKIYRATTLLHPGLGDAETKAAYEAFGRRLAASKE